MKEKLPELREVYPLIRPYVEMGMFSGEVRQALIVEKGIGSLSARIIDSAMGRGRVRGGLRDFTIGEKGDILVDQKSQSKRQALDQRVLRWLFTKAILTVHNEGLPEQSIAMPQGRLGWKDAIRKLEEHGMLDDIISTTKPLVLRSMPLIDTVKIYNNPPTGAMSHHEKLFLFVRKCLEEGLIGEDLSSWHDVHKLYVLHNRSFTKDTSERIRLEVWFRARNTTEGIQLLLKYKELGGAIDSEWFDKSLALEEDFIANASNINKRGYGEDSQGIFRVGSEGKFRTPIGLDDDGQIIFDTYSSRAKRIRSRDRIKEEAGSNRRPYSSLS